MGRQAFRRAKVPRADVYWTKALKLRNDLGCDATDAGTCQSNRTRSAGRKIEHPTSNERATVIDGHNDAAVAMGYPELGAERQRAVSAGHEVLVEALAGSGLAAGLVAVKGSYAGKGASGRHKGGVRVAPQ